MTAWHELTIGGSEAAARAFVAGFIAGRGGGAAVFARDVDVEVESLGARVRELFAAGSHHVVLAPEVVATALVAALERAAGEVSLRLERHRVVTAASFPFRLEVSARDQAERLRGALLRSLPAGVRVDDASEREESHPEARATDLYAPLHPWVYRASGRVVGALPGVLEVRRRASEDEAVDVGHLRIEGVDVG